MGDAVGSGERFSVVRGVLALGVMLGAARLPDRLATAGVELAGRIAPAPVPDLPPPHGPLVPGPRNATARTVGERRVAVTR